MQRFRWALLGWLGAGVALAHLGGCSASSSPESSACETSRDCPDERVCVDGECSEPSGMDGGGGTDSTTPMPDGTMPPPPGLESIAITPADPTLTSVDGSMPTVDFDLELTYDDGSTETRNAGFWSFDSPVLGEIDNTSGVLTAAGVVGGTGEVTVEAFSMTATTTATVAIERSVVTGDAPADAPSRFDGAPVDDPARAAGLLYPLDGAVFPQNVHPADIQWERGADGDLYRISMTAPNVDIRVFVAHSGAGFGYHWAATRDVWRAVAESAPETDVTIVVDRWEAASGEVVAGAPRTVRFAAANITGSIYYWDLGAGRIQRIRGDGTGLESFMPTPPPRPSDGKRCVACHAISQDGTKMAAELWDGGDYGAIFDLTEDLSGDPPPMVVPPTEQRFLTATFSPDASRLVANVGNELFLMDGTTGARITPGGAGLPSTQSAHPAWSPDGAHVAYVSNTNGGWGVDFSRGDLSVIPVMAGDAFGAPTTVLPGGSRVVARPSWSPDSQWIAIQYGTNSRSQRSGTDYPATVQLVSLDGGTVFDLAALNGGASNSYYPTFSPFDEGGYFWLAFFSTRDYGNAHVGTRGTGRRQLWVSAISNAPTAGTDPSHAPYWLPQQAVGDENMAAFWAPEPCRAEGRTCATSGECCSGFCRDLGDGLVCVPPDDVECSETGEACVEDADCCEGAGTCEGNRCSTLG